METVLKRENLFAYYDCEVESLKNRTIHSLAFRLFKHDFVNDEERKFFVGENKDIDSVYYIFKKTPPVSYDNIRSFLTHNAVTGTVFMYVLFYDKKKQFPGLVCAPVENNLEFGSKHITLVNYINDTRKDDMDDLVFVQAGELLKHDDYWEFNNFSGTFSLPRVKALESVREQHEDFEVSIADVEKMIDVTQGWMLTKDLLLELNPFSEFQFATRAFNNSEKLPLTSILKTVGSPEFYPYVIPGNETNYNSFRKAVAVIGTFSNLRSMNKMDVQVTSWASETVSNHTITALNMNDVDSHADHIAPVFNMFGSTPVTAFLGRTTVLPIKTDVKKALVVLRKVNAKRLEYGKNMNLNTSSQYIDMFDLSGKTYNISHKFHSVSGGTDFKARLEVVRFLASSNEEVYLCMMDGAQVVMKVFSLYPFNGTSRFCYYNYAREEAFYKSDVVSFAIPGCGAIGIVYPYLGTTISDIPLPKRVPLFPTFKEQYLELFLSMVKKDPFSNIFRTAYNDYKPENTTLDKDGNFKLIDYDESAFTPRFYGPTENREFANQLFGVLLVIHWFKTDEIPFDARSTGTQKLEWAKSLTDDSDVKDEFNILLDDKLSTPQKIKRLMTFRSR